MKMKNKKLYIGIAIVGLVVMSTLTACGNNNIGAGNYTYNYCHIQVPGSDYCHHYKIKSWRPDGDGSDWELTLQFKDGSTNNISIDGSWCCAFKTDFCPVCAWKIDGDVSGWGPSIDA